MKKLVVFASLVLSLVAQAAWQKIGVVQVADVNALVAGVAKIGEFTSNQTLGLMASSSVMEMPCVKLFGPGREGVPFALSLLWDGKDMEYAYLYPIAKTQKEFLAVHPGTVGKDGVIALKPEEDGDNEPRYVKFSADGQWVAFSDKKGQLEPAIRDVKVAAKPMKSDLVRLVIGKKGMDVVRKIYAKESAKEKDIGDKRLVEMLADCESLTGALAVDGKGLAIRGSLKTLKDSKLDQCGLKSLGDNPLAFAGKEALMANAIAADCGQTYFEPDEFLAVLAKHGIKTDFLSIDEKTENVSRVTLDIPAAVACFKSDTNMFEKVTKVELTADLEKLFEGQDAFKVENPAMAMSLAIKGYTTGATPVERVKTVLPEIAGKKPYTIQVWSLYEMMTAILPHVVSAMEPDEKTAFSPILATLPPPGKGGFACAFWREKNAHRFLSRVSADEFKSVSAGFSAYMAYQMQKMMKMQNLQMQTMPMDEDDDDED